MGSKFSRSRTPQPTPLFCAKGPAPYLWPEIPNWFWLLFQYEAPYPSSDLVSVTSRLQLFRVESTTQFYGEIQVGLSTLIGSYFFNTPSNPSILTGEIIWNEEVIDRPLDLVLNSNAKPPYSMPGSQAVPSFKGGQFTFFLWG